MSMSNSERTTLQAELAKPVYNGLTAREAWEKIHHKRSVSNPTPATQVPRPLAASEFAGLLSSTSLANFVGSPLANRILDAINNQDRVAIGLYATALAGASPPVINDAEKLAILSYLSSTVVDPEWLETIESPSVRDNIFPADYVWENLNEDGSVYYTNYIPLEYIMELRP